MIIAEKLKTYDPKKFRTGYMSIKRNGVHAIFDPETGTFYSRTPRKIQGLDHLIPILSQSQYPLVGELTVPGVDFEEASGRIRSHNPVPEASFSIFNAIVPGTKFRNRYIELQECFIKRFSTSLIKLQSNFISIEPMIPVDNLQSFNRFYDKAVANGHEGACWISSDHIYQPGKRTWDWMKRVPMKSIEVKIVAILPGTLGKKYEKSMGRMLCEFTDSKGECKEIAVGIFKGKTDEWRQGIYDRRVRYVGEKITIEFKDYSKYGVPTQPRFKGFRWDL